MHSLRVPLLWYKDISLAKSYKEEEGVKNHTETFKIPKAHCFSEPISLYSINSTEYMQLSPKFSIFYI